VTVEENAIGESDQVAITQVIAKYGATLDAGDVEGWVDTFAPDGVLHYPGGMVTGHFELREFFINMVQNGSLGKTPRLIMHLVGIPYITREDDVVSARTYGAMFNYSQDGAIRVPRITRYEDTLAFHDGRWLIAERFLHVDLEGAQ